MSDSTFDAMSLDDLWSLHEAVMFILVSKIEAQKLELEKRIDELGWNFRGSGDVRHRRPYPKVLPKFQNPAQPSKMWSGRGRQPRWVGEMLATGKSMDDLRISRSN